MLLASRSVALSPGKCQPSGARTGPPPGSTSAQARVAEGMLSGTPEGNSIFSATYDPPDRQRLQCFLYAVCGQSEPPATSFSNASTC